MEQFTIIGLAIAIWLLFSISYIILEGIFSHLDNMSLAAFFVFLAIAFLIATFIVQPERFGYIKIVSSNEVEMEVSRNETTNN